MPNLMSVGLLCGAGHEAGRGFTAVLAVWGFAPSSTESAPRDFCTVFGVSFFRILGCLPTGEPIPDLAARSERRGVLSVCVPTFCPSVAVAGSRAERLCPLPCDRVGAFLAGSSTANSGRDFELLRPCYIKPEETIARFLGLGGKFIELLPPKACLHPYDLCWVASTSR